MIFAVSMTFIDMTIVSIAAPVIQHKLGLTSTGLQWAINAYLLSLAAMFAFGGRLADTVGHTRMCVVGVLTFAGASAMCGLTPTGSVAEAWIVTFRVVQGFGGALMFPAALAIVVQTFDLRSRGRALALFFGIAGGLTALGPILGGILTQWTWRAIFWVNIPIAIIALVLIAISRPVTDHQPAKMDYRGLALIAPGVALSVLGFQESTIWGWSSPATWLCIVLGAVLLVVFVFVELRTESPLVQVRIFSIRAFAAENLVLFIVMLVFIPVFFFASEFAQLSLGLSSEHAGVVLLYFFIGFVVASQIGGRLLDKRGAKLPVLIGCVIAAYGFHSWGQQAVHLKLSDVQWPLIVTGFGMGMIISPANTDAINRAGRLAYGEATGITQTVRNYAASLGLAILGTLLISRLSSHVTASLVSQGEPPNLAAAQAAKLSQSQGGGSSLSSIPRFLRLDFAYATRSVLQAMALIMIAAAVAALIGLRWGVQEDQGSPSSAEPVTADVAA